MPMIGPSCATHLSCLEQASHDVVPDVLSVSISYTPADALTCLLILFVLRFYGPVNPMGSCRAWSVYLTSLLGRLSPLSGFCFCVEVLRPSQPNGVMSSAVSLPNHTFTGQA